MTKNEDEAGGARNEADEEERVEPEAAQVGQPSEVPSDDAEPSAPVDLDLAHDRAS